MTIRGGGDTTERKKGGLHWRWALGAALAFGLGAPTVTAQCDVTQLEKWVRTGKKFGWSKGSDGGHSVAMSGHTAIIGAFWDSIDGYTQSGSAFIFDATTGAEIANIAPEDPAAYANFGYDVCISGDTAVVGCWPDDDGRGAAYVFRDDGTGNWAQIAKILGPTQGGYFGRAVAINGNLVLVGATNTSTSALSDGAAYIYDVGSMPPTFVATLLASDPAKDDFFGYSVDISGDTAVVTARYDDDMGHNSGSVYVFRDDGTGNWSEFGKLVPTDGDAGFGQQVAIEGDTILVGATWAPGGGAAYLYRDDGAGGWTELRLQPTDNIGRFGERLDLSGGIAVIGANQTSEGGVQYTGAAYLYDAVTGTQIGKILPDVPTYRERLGKCVAIGDGYVVASNNHSSAYLFGVACAMNEPPIADCGGDITVPAGIPVLLDGSGSSDPDGDLLTFHWDVSDRSVVLSDPAIVDPVGIFPIGVTMVTLTVTDPSEAFDTCDLLVMVEDVTPPEVMCTSDVAVLWPPNHETHEVTLFIMGTDDVSSPEDITPTLVSITSDEPDDADGDGDGETTGDVSAADGYAAPVDVTAAFAFDPDVGDHGAWTATVPLRAERAGSGDGRCYSIEVRATDTAGNEAAASCCIVVPRDRRRR
jgi:hypothetical protein